MEIDNMPVAKPRPVTPQSILSHKIAILERAISNKANYDVLKELVIQCQNLAEPLDRYILENSSKPSSELQALELKTNTIDWSSAYLSNDTKIPLEQEMLSGSVEGQFLKMLVKISNSKKILEIGSFTGYASLAMAEALPEDGKLIACEYDPYTAKFAQDQLNLSSHKNKIEIKIGNATETLIDLGETNHIFDFIFIDADKQNYITYFNMIIELGLLNDKGIICVDNTLLQGQTYNAGKITQDGLAIAKFNIDIAKDLRFHKVLIPLRDGITIIRKIS